MNIQKKLLSVNYSTATNKKKGICIHTMVGTLDSTDGWFKNPASQVSSHYGVDLTTDSIYQWVEENNTAWAQGVVSGPTNELVLELGGNPNAYFISIECADGRNSSGADRSLQEKTVGVLVADIAKRNGIPLDRKHVCGHREIYNKKSCPGNLDVDRILEIAKNQSLDMVTLPQSEVDKLREERDRNWNLYGSSQQELEATKKLNAELNADYEGVKQELSSYKGILQTFATLLGTKVSETEKMSGEIKRLIEKEDMYTSVSKMNENLMNDVGTLQSDISTKNTTISELNVALKDTRTVLDICRAKKEVKELKEYSWITRLRSLFS